VEGNVCGREEIWRSLLTRLIGGTFKEKMTFKTSIE
jgi:hypothetical protein